MMWIRVWMFCCVVISTALAVPPAETRDPAGHTDWMAQTTRLVPAYRCPRCANNNKAPIFSRQPFDSLFDVFLAIKDVAQSHKDLDPCRHLHGEMQWAQNHLVKPVLLQRRGLDESEGKILLSLAGAPQLPLSLRHDLVSFTPPGSGIRLRGLYSLMRCPTTPQNARLHIMGILQTEGACCSGPHYQFYQRVLSAAERCITVMHKTRATSVRLNAAWGICQGRCADFVEQIFMDMLDTQILEGERKAIMAVIALWPDSLVEKDLKISKRETVLWLLQDVFKCNLHEQEQLYRVAFPRGGAEERSNESALPEKTMKATTRDQN